MLSSLAQSSGLSASHYFHWDPDPTAFIMPLLDRPVAWYGILFALGFFLAYLVTRKLFVLQWHQAEPEVDVGELDERATRMTDRLTWIVLLGTVIGARLGHVFFYGWSEFKNHPLDIIKVWEGGLASHGGVVGVLIALYLFCRRSHQISLMRLVDTLAIPAALLAGMIRLGNFVNQEIVGRVTDVPWAVVFGHPMDGALPLPRHPVVLYEALCYFLIFALLWNLAKKRHLLCYVGRSTGMLFVMVFGSRFFLEFFKMRQSSWVGEKSLLLMGQYLSLPFVLIGGWLWWRSIAQSKHVERHG